MIYWAPFLHFYQPPTQDIGILEKISDESYRPLVKLFLAHPEAKATINISAVLTEMLANHGGEDIIDGLRKIAENKQLEFTESAKFHAILPLIPKKEALRQIELNHITNEYFFKSAYGPRGFFPPEMCYSDLAAEIISAMGYEWILISGIAANCKWPVDYISRVSFGHSSLLIFYRDDILSNKISFHRLESAAFIKELGWLTAGKENAYVITAMDAETFGHHIPEWETSFLAKVYELLEEEPGIKVAALSELAEKFPAKNTSAPKPSSWSTIKDDIVKKNYYPLWKGRNNPIHDLQWKHLHIVLELVCKALELKGEKESEYLANAAREALDKAFHSCQFWWANKKRGLWGPNMIEKGLVLQEEALRNASKAIARSSANDNIKRFFYKETESAKDMAKKIRLLIAAK